MSTPDDPNSVKEKIHSFRYPLGSRGSLVAALLYVGIPTIAGYFIMKTCTPSSAQQAENVKAYAKQHPLHHDSMMHREALDSFFKSLPKRHNESPRKPDGS